jgi:AcrR family transcriptional regulator
MDNPTEEAAPTNKPYHHGDLRNALITAGLAILAEEGAAALSLRQVARRAQVSHAAPYRHFASKEALLAAIAEEGFHELAARLGAAGERFATDTPALWQEISWIYVNFAQERPDHLRIMFSNLIGGRTAYPSLMQAGLGAFQVLVEMIQRGQEAGAIAAGDPHQIALAAWSLVHGLSVLLVEDQIGFVVAGTDAEQLARTFAERLYTGIAKS